MYKSLNNRALMLSIHNWLPDWLAGWLTALLDWSSFPANWGFSSIHPFMHLLIDSFCLYCTGYVICTQSSSSLVFELHNNHTVTELPLNSNHQMHQVIITHLWSPSSAAAAAIDLNYTPFFSICICRPQLEMRHSLGKARVISSSARKTRSNNYYRDTRCTIE